MGERPEQTLRQRGYIKTVLHMKRYSTTLAITEMQIKTMMRSHYTPIRMAKIKYTDNTKCWQNSQQLELLCITKVRECKMAQCGSILWS